MEILRLNIYLNLVMLCLQKNVFCSGVPLINTAYFKKKIIFCWFVFSFYLQQLKRNIGSALLCLVYSKCRVFSSIFIYIIPGKATECLVRKWSENNATNRKRVIPLGGWGGATEERREGGVWVRDLWRNQCHGTAAVQPCTRKHGMYICKEGETLGKSGLEPRIKFG